jgi:tight adherence protein B
MGIYIIIGLVALGIAGAVFAVSLIFVGDDDKVADRLASLTQNGGRGTASLDDQGPSSLLRTPFEDSPDQVEKQFKSVIQFFDLRKFIEQSGLKISVSNFMLMTLGFGGVAGVLGFLFTPYMWISILAALIAAPLPYLWVMFSRKRRLGKFSAQLPGALDLMSQALRAGQSLPAGIQLVGQQLPEPLGPEFALAYEQQNLGSTVTDSLEQMCERVPDLDLRFFTTAVVLQRQTGGDLAEILDKISHLIRERFQIRGMIQALTGEGRISGVVLLGLPPVLMGVMLKINYEYVMKLFSEPLGNQMVVFAVVMQVFGAIWIKKIIDIKV